MSYLIFHLEGETKSGKTRIWSVKNINGAFLGRVKWHGPWRKYVFEGAGIFDETCLDEISKFLLKETIKHKEPSDAIS